MGGQEKDAEWTGAERRAAEVRLSEDTVRYLESRMAESVAKGMRDAMTEEAAAAGVFGVPTVSVDGRTFFGVDGLPMLRAYLQGDAWFAQGRWDGAASVEQGLQA